MKSVKFLAALAAAAMIAGSAAADDTIYTFDDLSTYGVTFDKSGIRDGMNDFASTLLVAAPQSAVQQNVWSDAYIGKFFPSLPMHFGVGLSLGGTKLDMSGLKAAAKSFESAAKSATGSNVDFGTIPSSFFLPTISIDARIGGIIFPFDIGVSFMMTNPSLTGVNFDDPDSITDASQAMTFSWMGFDGSLDYITFGLDARYAIWEGNLLLPKLSVGAGYVYTRGQVGVTSSESNTKANLDLSYSTHVIFLETQVSKNFLVATVFAGGRALLSNTTTSWAWDIATSYTTSGDVTLTVKDSDSGSYTSDGYSSDYKHGDFDFSRIQPQVFAGASFNFIIFQATANICADVRSFMDSDNYDSALWSGALSFHVKL
ncbi:hypothetical protein [Treponema sp.]|uniref:hypothetical protein n=1 Tax=Treponema sp. TaxID=166 RepID=UPI0025CFAC30|nr:hypothetical protein [Treponema sp.]MCR5217497.1 hypothetical protein [Treponema sp.]